MAYLTEYGLERIAQDNAGKDLSVPAQPAQP